MSAIAVSPDADERFPRASRLTRRVDYVRCYRRGRRRHGTWLTVHVHPNDVGHARLGITASRKVGKAVIRQRLKRRIREIFRRWPQRAQLPAADLVVHLRPKIGDVPFDALRVELDRLFADALRPPPRRRNRRRTQAGAARR
ncbi:MAG: ribonuclease P protein component [Acidobacteriota bacterium]